MGTRVALPEWETAGSSSFGGVTLFGVKHTGSGKCGEEAPPGEPECRDDEHLCGCDEFTARLQSPHGK